MTFGSGSVDATVADGALATMATSRADVVLDRLALAVDRALETARAVDEHADVDGVAMAFPGPFDLEEATPRLRGLQKFDSIYGLDLRPEFGRRSTLGDVPIVFVRDSDAIGVGEAVFGAGRSARRVLTVALGTGCGTCLTYDGTVVGEVGGCTIELLHERSTPEGSVDDVLSARGLAQLLDIDPADIGRCLTSEPLDDRAVAAVEDVYKRQRDIGVVNVFTVRRLFSEPARLTEVTRDLQARGIVDDSLDPGRPLDWLLGDGKAATLIEAAYRYALFAPGVTSVMTGTIDHDQLRQNIALVDKGPLPAEDLDRLSDLFAGIDEPMGN